MPMFDFKCKKCGQIDEYIVKLGQTKGLECRKCGSKALTKLLCAATVVANPNHREPPNYGAYKRNPLYD